jgi:hypothetical protein
MTLVQVLQSLVHSGAVVAWQDDLGSEETPSDSATVTSEIQLERATRSEQLQDEWCRQKRPQEKMKEGWKEGEQNIAEDKRLK